MSYVMRISRLTVDKLGVKLYDKASAVLAELVANSYDADATEVVIKAPMGDYLATRQEGEIHQKGFTIEVIDNGSGMTPDEVNRFYLVVGAERRKDPQRGATSKQFSRKVMGRKGVGKLAPFGICQRIELISAGGPLVKAKDENGEDSEGYLTAHLFLDREQILQDTEFDYEPMSGVLDGKLSSKQGTTLKLTIFDNRKVPNINDLERQLAQRFGVQTSDWKIILVDSNKTDSDPDFTRDVGDFEIATMEHTQITFDLEKNPDGSLIEHLSYRAFNHEGNILTDIRAGFSLNERFYPITGWVAYAKEPYRDDLMAGVRIYCHNKIAAQTTVFNKGAGFTGEYDIRSYLVGELNADWLDEEEDLIQTDRRDILWSSEVGQAFEKWGQGIIQKIGNIARNPLKQKTWDLFEQASGIQEKVERAFPAEGQKTIREQTLGFAKLIGKTMRRAEIDDPEQVEAIVQLSLTVGPHITLDDKLREAAEAKDSPLGVITGLLMTARVAELSSFGQIADKRVKIINRIETLKDGVTTEDEFQNLIEEAPWLIDPQWSPITSNQSLATLRSEFQKYYRSKTGVEIELSDFSKPTKRPDFVLSTQEGVIQIIEIKKPHHLFDDTEMIRLNTYVEQMENFLKDSTHKEFTQVFRGFQVTLVCDGEKLTGVNKTAYWGLVETRRLIHIDWTVFLLRTKRMHQEFLDEAERQMKNAAKEF